MSILRPFSRPLKVGGNKENIAKLMVWLAALAPSNVIVKLFAVDAGKDVGVKDTLIWSHVVYVPLIGTEADA